jgi:hypothetical protein
MVSTVCKYKGLRGVLQELDEMQNSHRAAVTSCLACWAVLRIMHGMSAAFKGVKRCYQAI